MGIIYQMNKGRSGKRGFIGRALLVPQFEWSAYGCRLYCCWKVQESAGESVLGGDGLCAAGVSDGGAKKEPRAYLLAEADPPGDATTPWCFRARRSGGAIREDRIALADPAGDALERCEYRCCRRMQKAGG